MKKNLFLTGMLVVMLAFGLMVVGCDIDSENGGGSGSGSTFTVVDIPSKYNGKYAMFATEDIPLLAGFQSINMSTGVITLVKISNGKVSLPMWVAGDNGYTRFSGNRTVSDCMVSIWNTSPLSLDTPDEAMLDSLYFFTIAFSNGSATRSWSEGMLD